MTASVLRSARPYWSGSGLGKYAVASEVPGWEGGTHLAWFPADDAHLWRCPFCSVEVDGASHCLQRHEGLLDGDGLVLRMTSLGRVNAALYAAKSAIEYRRLVADVQAKRKRWEEAAGGRVVWPALPAYEPELEGQERRRPGDHRTVLAKYVPMPGREEDPDWLWKAVQETGLSRRQITVWCHSFRRRCGRTSKSRRRPRRAGPRHPSRPS